MEASAGVERWWSERLELADERWWSLALVARGGGGGLSWWRVVVEVV